ncbi:MAG: nucleotidyltransferase family protein [Nanobdellota archaeon]
MEVIILAAGYATRMYPLTKNFPKPLLKISGKPLLEHILEKIKPLKPENIKIVTNNKFYELFRKYEKNNIKIINDGSISPENKLGAIKDMCLATENNKEHLVIAADNLIEFSLEDFYNFHKKSNTNTLAVKDMKDKEIIKNKHGVAVINKNNEVIEFQEKPENPKSTMKSICCYLFKKDIKETIENYLKGNNPDATGYFMEYLVRNTNVKAFEFKENVYDIGSLETYEMLKDKYKKNF